MSDKRSSSDFVPPGYKRTEVGVIPEDWEVVEVKSIAELGRGRVISHHEIAQALAPQYPVYSSQTTNDGVMGYLDTFDFEGEFVTWTTDGVNAGKVFYRKGRFNCTNVCGVLKIRTHYALFVALALDRVARKYVSTNLANPKLMNNVMATIKLAIPKRKEEQRAIARALADADAWIEALDRLIAKKRAIKQAAMGDLLTGRVRLPGFGAGVGMKCTEIGEIPEDWEARKLDEIAIIDPESLNANTPQDLEFKYIAIDDVDKGRLLKHSLQIFKTAPSRARKVIRENDILLGTVRPNLQSHLLFNIEENDWVCSTGFAVIRTKAGISIPEFIFAQLFSDVIGKQIDVLLTGTSYPAISSKDVGNLVLPLPPFSEQQAIAQVLSDMDAEIEALERERDKARAIKQGMMQELLTGRIRLLKPQNTPMI